MKLRLNLLRGDGSHNLQITTDATATVGDVAAALASAGPSEAGQAIDPATVSINIIDTAGRGRARALTSDTLLEDSGLHSGAKVSLMQNPADTNVAGEHVAVLSVVSGPDRGRVFPLYEGSNLVGRDDNVDVSLSDPMVSKQHMRVVVGTEVEVRDLNSSNGVVVNGQRVQRLKLGPLDSVKIGKSEVKVALVTTTLSATDAAGSAGINFIRTPRVVPRTPAVEIKLPEAPTQQNPNPLPFIAMLAPAFMGLMMYSVTHNPYSLMFVCMSPMMMGGMWVDGKWRRKRALKEQLEAFEVSIKETQKHIEQVFANEREVRKQQYPPIEAIVRHAEMGGPLLWSRRPEHPEFMQIRIGLGTDLPVARMEKDKEAKNGLPQCLSTIAALRAQYAMIDDVPIVANLRQDGAFGISGLRADIDPVARAVITQLVCMHSPAELVVACLTDPAGRSRWDWLEWLPHTASPFSPLGELHLAADAAVGASLVSHLEEIIFQRLQTRPRPRGPLNPTVEETDAMHVPDVVVIVDQSQVDQARLNRIVESGPDVGVHVIWVAESASQVPAACRSYLTVSGSESTVGFVRRSVNATNVRPENLGLSQVRALAKHMSPMVDAGVPVDDDSDLPRSISFISLTGAELADDASAQVARWQATNSIIDRTKTVPMDRPVSLSALVGQGADAPLALDLRVHGPHALVGGTTGAGKSEFLQSWVLGMAQAVSPDRLTFLFVDYKGGSAFAACTHLPHCVGLVTDLSPAMVRRALTSLGAEIHYRERLLNEKGKKDLAELEKSGDPECPPSLIIVVDEFAALAGEVPEFVDGVVDVAQRGRSLGLHLIMATQRPAGVIKDNLRANTNLRVALRMADESDSQDVLGEKIAAHFPPEIPGRGAAKTGPGRITPFQSAYPGARTSAQATGASVSVDEMTFGALNPWQVAKVQTSGRSIDKDIDRVVATVGQAARIAGLPVPRKPWLDELATAYDLNHLPQRRDTKLVLGVVDDPVHQIQVPAYFLPEKDSNICFFGAAGSGKSTALRSLALAASITPRSGAVDIYGMDFAGASLKVLEKLPSVGTIVSGDDSEGVERLLRKLSSIIDERTDRFTAASAGTLSDYQRISGHTNDHRILLLLDGLGAMRSEYEKTVYGAANLDILQRILTDGRSVGVHVAATCDWTTPYRGNVLSAFLMKVVLRQSNMDDYINFGVAKDVLSPASPPGRAMIMGDGREMQLAIMGDSSNEMAQAQLIEAFGKYLSRQGRIKPEAIANLPTELSEADLPKVYQGWPVLGMASQDLDPATFVPTGAMMVAGPPQAATTSALLWLAGSLKQWDPKVRRVFISPRRSALADVAGLWDLTMVGDEQIKEGLEKIKDYVAMQAPDNHPLLVLVVEHYPEVVGTPVEKDLLAAVKQAKRSGHLVIAEGETSGWSGYSPMLAEIKNSRTGLLIQPDTGDGETLLRTPTPRIQRGEMVPGRGYWISAAKAVKVQIVAS